MTILLILAAVPVWLIVGFAVTCWCAYVDAGESDYGGLAYIAMMLWPITLVAAIALTCQWIGEGSGGLVGHLLRQPMVKVDRLAHSGRRKHPKSAADREIDRGGY